MMEIAFSRPISAVVLALDLFEGLGLRATVLDDDGSAATLRVPVPQELASIVRAVAEVHDGQVRYATEVPDHHAAA